MQQAEWSAKPSNPDAASAAFIFASDDLSLESAAFKAALKGFSSALAGFNANPSVAAFMSAAQLPD